MAKDESSEVSCRQVPGMGIFESIESRFPSTKLKRSKSPSSPSLKVTLRPESPSIFLENILKMKESLLSVICHTVISSLQLAFQEARPSSNASIRLVIRQ